MKKNSFNEGIYFIKKPKKLLLTMRLTVLLSLICLLPSIASVYSQEDKISLDIDNKAIKEVLREIEMVSEYRFFFSDDLLPLSEKVDVNVRDESVKKILDGLLEDKALSYELVKNNLVLIIPGNFYQTLTIKGKVTDIEGLPLPGVNIVERGTTSGAVTDLDGEYTIPVSSPDAILSFSYVGYLTEEIEVSNQTTINVTLIEDIQSLDEVVVVGYGTQRKGNVTGSVSSVKSDELVTSPVASSSNLLAGKLPGLISLQHSGQPGADEANLSIRGFGSALIIVDGVETSFNNIDPNQIESISILKDGSASIYGARAGNGVILVTTKRGKISKPTFSINSSATWQGVTRVPRPVSSGQYAEMAREEWLQEGNPEETAPYTQEEIEKFYAGTDPQYPNTDWYKVLTRDWAPQQQHNVSVRGGSEKIKYFGLLGYLNQETMWVESDGAYKRYNLQSNIDAQILDNLSLRLDISGNVEDRNFTSRDWGQSIWGDFWSTTPTVPATYPDDTKIPMAHYYTSINSANLTSSRDLWGYSDTDDENLSGTLSLDYDFKAIKGLSAKVFTNYLKNNGSHRNFEKSFILYSYDYESDIYTESGSRTNSTLNIRRNSTRTLTSQFSLNYENTFIDAHQLSALLMYEIIDTKTEWVQARREGFLTNEIDQMFAGSTENMFSNGAAGEMGRASYIGRLNYSYKYKYLFETTFRADASAKFDKNDRWGFFPSFSLGWRITEEDFMKGISILDQLKLRASYGRSGNDNVGNFQYLSGYRFDDTYIFEGTRIEQGLITTGLANPYLTWEDITLYNLGLDYQLLNRKIYGEAEIFYRERSGIPATKLSTLPSTFGASLPQENINSLNNRGFDFLVGTAGNLNKFSWDISGNISWSRAKWEHFEEPEYTDPDQKRIEQRSGQWTDRVFGYLSDGLFTSQEEINSLEFDQDQKGNVSLRPGDVKYIDTNNDGILDWKDRVEIGKGGLPHWMFGTTINLKYRNFDFSTLFQGAFGHYVAINLNTMDAVSPATRYELRWTEENNDPDALEPRLGGSSLNDEMSDYRLKSASYVRLKTASLGYNLPTTVVQKLGIEKLRIYVAGTNLLTFDKLKVYDIDPELPSGRAGLYYPQQRTISLGLNVSL